MLLRRRRARGVLIPHTQPSCEFSFHCVREQSMYELVSVRARIREPLENIIINTRSSVCAKRNARVYAHRRCRFCFTVAGCTHAGHLTQQYDSLLLLRARAIYISLSPNRYTYNKSRSRDSVTKFTGGHNYDRVPNMSTDIFSDMPAPSAYLLAYFEWPLCVPAGLPGFFGGHGTDWHGS